MLFIIVEVFFFFQFIPFAFFSHQIRICQVNGISLSDALHTLMIKQPILRNVQKRGKAKQWAKSEPHVTSEMGSPGSGV